MATAPTEHETTPRIEQSQQIARLGLDLERMSSNHDRLDARIDAISQSLPIFKATLGHEALLDELSARREHPVHALLRRYAEEYAPTSPEPTSTREAGAEAAWRALQTWMGGQEG